MRSRLKLYNKFDNLDEMETFIEKCNLPKLIQEEKAAI